MEKWFDKTATSLKTDVFAFFCIELFKSTDGFLGGVVQSQTLCDRGF